MKRRKIHTNPNQYRKFTKNFVKKQFYTLRTSIKTSSTAQILFEKIKKMTSFFIKKTRLRVVNEKKNGSVQKFSLKIQKLIEYHLDKFL